MKLDFMAAARGRCVRSETAVFTCIYDGFYGQECLKQDTDKKYVV